MRQRDAAKRFFAVPVLCCVGAQELPPCRRVEVKLLHGHRGARCERRRLWHPDLAAIDFYTPRVSRVAGARGQAQTRYGGDRGQCLTAKTQRSDRLEVVRIGDLGGGVSCDREGEILALDPRAVVCDANELDATCCEVDVDRSRAGIEAVLEQLLQGRGRPLDYLASGDLID